MNIFYLDHNPRLAAEYHCDKHVVKMITETCQLLSTAHHEFKSSNEILMKPTHKNHPSAIWVRESANNYMWARDLLKYLIEEYDIRYGKKDKFLRAREIITLDPPVNLLYKGMTEIKLAMPDDCKKDCPVESYRTYYLLHKKTFAKWKNKIPHWWTEIDT